MRVLILTGGESSERKISLLSARNVKKTLIENGHIVRLYDLKNGYSQIKKISNNYDVIFPVLHGEEGEGGELHKYISKINKPIVGGRNYKEFAKAWYKIPFKKYCDKNKILTPKWRIVKNEKDVINFGLPCVLKTSSGGSSKEVFILKSKSDLNKCLIIFKRYSDLFVEEYIKGTEITIGILNKKALPALEIIAPNNGWFDYKNKYSGETKEILNAPSLKPEIVKLAQEIALKIHKNFDIGSYSRIDFIVRTSKIYALELNTIPGLTEQSLLPKATKTTFNNFLEILLKSAK